MSEVYDYIVSNFPTGLMAIFLVPLAFLAIWKAVIKVFNKI